MGSDQGKICFEAHKKEVEAIQQRLDFFLIWSYTGGVYKIMHAIDCHNKVVF